MVSAKQRAGAAKGLFVLGTLIALVMLERRRPLRKATTRKLPHDARNLAVAAVAGACVTVVEAPLIGLLLRLVERRRIGLLKIVRLPRPLETILAVVLLDYTLFAWHWLTHVARPLWRFHEPHHVDLDLDATTALRFHFAEMMLSVPFRAAQVVVIGVSQRAFSIWQTATMVAILFHHSNVRLPAKLERWLSFVIVTPRMHGIHHSTVRRETDSNWSTIFSFFDRLHGTLRLNVPQHAITIGVPAYRDERELGLRDVLALPFRRQRFAWTRPGQLAPQRAIFVPSRTTLAT